MHRALLTCLALVACSTAPEPETFSDEVVFESEHFRLHAHAGDTNACSSSTSDLEAHFSALRDLLGFAWPSGQRIEYRLYSSQSDFEQHAPCSGVLHTDACARDNRVYTTRPVHEHELIHAYLAGVGHPPSYMVEGIADLLSCDYPPWTAPRAEEARTRLSTIDWQSLAQWAPASDRNGDDYQLSAELVRTLLDRFGVQAVLAYYANAPATSNASAVNADFESAFKSGMADLLQQALAENRPDGACLHPYQCAQGPLADSASEALPESCGLTTRYRTLLLAETGFTSVSISAEKQRLPQAFIRSCDGQASPRNDDGQYGRSAVVAALLPSGRYFVGLPGAPVAFNLSRKDTPSAWLANDCASALAAPYAFGSQALNVDVPMDGSTYYIALSTSSADVFVDTDRALPLALCRSCDDDPATCQSVPVAPEALSVNLQGSYVLKLQTSDAPGDFRWLRIRPQ